MIEIGLLEAELSLILSFNYDRKSAILKMASHMSLHHFRHVYPRKYTCRPSLDHRATVKLRDPQNFYGSIGWVLDHNIRLEVIDMQNNSILKGRFKEKPSVPSAADMIEY